MDWINWSDFWGVDVYDYELKQRELMWIFSSGEMVNVALDMVDCFLSGNGVTYSNEILTQKARNQTLTILPNDILEASFSLGF